MLGVGTKTLGARRVNVKNISLLEEPWVKCPLLSFAENRSQRVLKRRKYGNFMSGIAQEPLTTKSVKDSFLI